MTNVLDNATAAGQPNKPVSIRVHDIDQNRVPAEYRLGDAYVPKGRYIDPNFLQLEIERIFPNTWLFACRLEELHDVGDYVEYEIAKTSIVIVREAKDKISAYHNACRHRGTRLAAGRGRVGELRCPFHGWRWNLDGSIKLVLDREEFLERSDEDYNLVPVNVDTWGGFVFVNMRADAEPLLDYLSPLPETLAPFQLENMRYKWLKATIMDCNWKTGLDAFMEAYHVPGTHPQLLRYDKYNTNPASLKELEHRIYTPTSTYDMHASFNAEVRKTGSYESMASGPTMDARKAMSDYVKYMAAELRSLDTDRDAAGPAEEILTVDIPDGSSVAEAYRTLRAKYAKADGLDWPEITAQQWESAGADIHMFPNTILLPNQGSLLGYRARPLGDDPDRCLFEAFDLETIPVADYDKKWDFEPQYFENWREADLGGILNQDFASMPHVTVGMHSPSYDGHRLNVMQEMTVYHHHQVADRFLWSDD